MSRRHTLPPAIQEEDQSKQTPIYSENYFDIFKCHYCKEYYTAPVVECRNRHIICSKCCIESEISKLQVCPLCKSNTEPRRHLEQLMRDHKLECIYRSRGCTYDTLHNYSSHIKSCEFKSKLKCYHSLLCSLENSCEWEDLEEKLFDHFIEDHKIVKYDLVKNDQKFIFTSHFPDRDSSRNSFIVIQFKTKEGESKQLLLEFVYMSLYERLYYLLRSKEKGLFLKYELGLVNPETKENEKTLILTSCDFSGNYTVDIPHISSRYLGYFHISKVEKFKFLNCEESPGFMLSVKFL